MSAYCWPLYPQQSAHAVHPMPSCSTRTRDSSPVYWWLGLGLASWWLGLGLATSVLDSKWRAAVLAFSWFWFTIVQCEYRYRIPGPIRYPINKSLSTLLSHNSTIKSNKLFVIIISTINNTQKSSFLLSVFFFNHYTIYIIIIIYINNNTSWIRFKIHVTILDIL